LIKNGNSPQTADTIIMNRSMDVIRGNIPEYILFSAVNITKMHKTFHLPSLSRPENTMNKTLLKFIKLISKISFYLTILFMFVSFIISRKNLIIFIMPLSYMLFDIVIHGLTYCVPRYAEPMYPLYLMFAASGLVLFYQSVVVKVFSKHLPSE
jgi:hypothetical protein